jgi:hypothetical protein
MRSAISVREGIGLQKRIAHFTDPCPIHCSAVSGKSVSKLHRNWRRASMSKGKAGATSLEMPRAMVVANVNAAQKGVSLRGKPATPLWLRTPMLVLFIALLWWSTRP